jgi:rhodanese-related sulfurtransferase
MIQTIAASDFSKLVAAGKVVDLIDVRTPVEFREVHLAMARNEPLDQLDPQAIQAGRKDRSTEPLYVICRSGARGKQACEVFVTAGMTNVINIEGGTMACLESGIPIVRGQKAISLERQVRITAGLLVCIGTALGYFVHPYWIALSAFIGAGLVFAGVTDTCGMGMMLAKMPWNKIR